jgi:hypothetical protein
LAVDLTRSLIDQEAILTGRLQAISKAQDAYARKIEATSEIEERGADLLQELRIPLAGSG